MLKLQEMEKSLPNLTVTFLIEYKNKFLLIHRGINENNEPGKWAFPGGKAELGETAIDTIEREAMEETGLTLTDEAIFLDSYSYKTSVGIAFLVRAQNDRIIKSSDVQDYIWVASLKELKKFDCVEGIRNHFVRAKQLMGKGIFDSKSAMNLTRKKYI